MNLKTFTTGDHKRQTYTYIKFTAIPTNGEWGSEWEWAARFVQQKQGQRPCGTSLSSLSASSFICALQGCTSSKWNDLLMGTPPSKHAHTHTHFYLSISRAHANRINLPSKHRIPATHEDLLLLWLLICDLVKRIFPHQTLLLFILHISHIKLVPGYSTSAAVMLLTAFVRTSHRLLNNVFRSILRWLRYLYFTSAEFLFHN